MKKKEYVIIFFIVFIICVISLFCAKNFLIDRNVQIREIAAEKVEDNTLQNKKEENSALPIEIIEMKEKITESEKEDDDEEIIIDENDSNKEKIEKGYEVFGTEKCSLNGDVSVTHTDKDHPGVSCAVVTNWTCRICGKEDTSGYSDAPAICFDCAKATNRCNKCGKLLGKSRD